MSSGAHHKLHKFTSVFLDAPWFVATFLGLWGVMIGMEDFFLADLFFIAAGVLCCVKLGKETNLRGKERKLVIFIVAFVAIMTTIGLDLRWTTRKSTEANIRREQLSHLSEIPNLKGELQKMKDKQDQTAVAQAIAQGKEDTKLSLIETENKELRKSVETKDAALVQIAKEQYSLNFFPEVFVSNEGVIDTAQIINNGKTNVDVYEIDLEGVPQDVKTVPALVVPGSRVGFQISAQQKQYIANHALGGTGVRIPIDCTVYLLTLDKKRYSLRFTWFFDAKDGVPTKSDTVDHPIAEIRQP